MKTFDVCLFINELKIFSHFVHGSSKKFLKDKNGIKKPFRPGVCDGSIESVEHRKIFFEELGCGATKPFLVKQVHGDKIFVLDSPSTSSEQAIHLEADAIVTPLQDIFIGVLTADCIPIVLFDTCNRAVGVVHAGRMGTVKNILSKTVNVFVDEFQCRVEDLVMGLGPGICGNCYEVDEDCIDPFKKSYPDWQEFATRKTENKFMLDLYQANTLDGMKAGVPEKNIFRSPFCTSCRNDLLYSYRKEGAKERILTVVMSKSNAG